MPRTWQEFIIERVTGSSREPIGEPIVKERHAQLAARRICKAERDPEAEIHVVRRYTARHYRAHGDRLLVYCVRWSEEAGRPLAVETWAPLPEATEGEKVGANDANSDSRRT